MESVAARSPTGDAGSSNRRRLFNWACTSASSGRRPRRGASAGGGRNRGSAARSRRRRTADPRPPRPPRAARWTGRSTPGAPTRAAAPHFVRLRFVPRRVLGAEHPQISAWSKSRAHRWRWRRRARCRMRVCSTSASVSRWLRLVRTACMVPREVLCRTRSAPRTGGALAVDIPPMPWEASGCPALWSFVKRRTDTPGRVTPLLNRVLGSFFTELTT